MTLGHAIQHIGVEVDDGITAEDLAYKLNAAPLGAINPALEAAIVTARFLAGMTSKAEFVSRLERQISDAS